MVSLKLTTTHLKDALRHPGVEAPPMDELAVESLHTIVMDLNARRLEISDGARGEQYRIFEL